MSTETRSPVLLAYAFRPFFLLTGLFAVWMILAWAGFYLGVWQLPLGLSPLHWHSHEVLYGLVPAAIAGFLLTAMATWTGAPPLRGTPLLLMILAWLAGRIAMGFAAVLPAAWVAAIDLVFLPVLALYAGMTLVRYKNWRNLVLVGVLLVLSLGNALMHGGFILGDLRLLRLGELTGLDTITLLMLVVAGRITPAFTRNWLRLRDANPDVVRQENGLALAALVSAALLLPLDWVMAPQALIAAIAILAGLLNLTRLLQWSGWHTAAEPLLWILHIAYGWICLALLLRGIAGLGNVVSADAWQHALGVGAIGTLLLGVMTRVSLGHTGRQLQLPRYGIVIYVAILSAAILRLLAAMTWLDFNWGIALATALWVIAFTLFLILYTPILMRPRPDGRPG